VHRERCSVGPSPTLALARRDPHCDVNSLRPLSARETLGCFCRSAKRRETEALCLSERSLSGHKCPTAVARLCWKRSNERRYKGQRERLERQPRERCWSFDAMSVTFGYYEDRSGDAAQLQALRLKLAAVDHAINKLRESGTTAAEEQGTETLLPPLLLPHSPRPAPNSQIIDTTSRQMGCCPKCFVEMPLSLLRCHMARDCSDLMITCPEVGCLAEFPQTELERHLAKECRITKHRRQLIQQAQVRKEEKRLAALELAREAAARTGGHSHISSNYSMEFEESGSSWGRHAVEEEEPEAEPPIPHASC
jgi:hypothetical protein